MAHLHTASLNSMMRYAPVWVHLFVYVVTCLFAATVFYFDYRPVVVLVEYFSGAIIPKEYTLQEAAVLWALLLGAPFLFTLGFLWQCRFAYLLHSHFCGKSLEEVTTLFQPGCRCCFL
jgi:hypothetical protein